MIRTDWLVVILCASRVLLNVLCPFRNTSQATSLLPRRGWKLTFINEQRWKLDKAGIFNEVCRLRCEGARGPGCATRHSCWLCHIEFSSAHGARSTKLCLMQVVCCATHYILARLGCKLAQLANAEQTSQPMFPDRPDFHSAQEAQSAKYTLKVDVLWCCLICILLVGGKLHSL